MNNPIEAVESAHYAATEEQVEALAHLQYTTGAKSQQITGTYLRVLVAGCQEALRAKRNVTRTRQLQVLQNVHARYYAAVLRGVSTEDVIDTPDLEPTERTRRAVERNRRSTFARSAKSTLSLYVRAGGQIRKLKVDTVTKGMLRGETHLPLEAMAAQVFARAQSAMIRIAQAQAKGNPEAARTRLLDAITALRAALKGLPAHRAPRPRLDATARRRASATRRRGTRHWPHRTNGGAPAHAAA